MAARKKTASKKAVARRGTGTAMTTSAWEEEIASHVGETREMLKGTGGKLFISTKSGRFTFDGTVLEEPMSVVVLDSVLENLYYEGAYDADNPTPPVCYAIGRNKNEMKPDPGCPEPQAETCKECWANKWKSAETGKGKACRNMLRLGLLPARDASAESLANVEPALIRVPPTSVPIFNGYANKIEGGLNRPVFSVVTDMELEDSDKNQFEFVFTLNDKVTDGAAGSAIMQQRASFAETLMSMPDAREYEAAETPAPKRRAAKKKASAPAKKKATSKKSARRKF